MMILLLHQEDTTPQTHWNHSTQSWESGSKEPNCCLKSQDCCWDKADQKGETPSLDTINLLSPGVYYTSISRRHDLLALCCTQFAIYRKVCLISACTYHSQCKEIDDVRLIESEVLPAHFQHVQALNYKASKL